MDLEIDSKDAPPATSAHRCMTCKASKGVDAFAPAAQRRRRWMCRSCKSESNKRHYASHTDVHLLNHIRKKLQLPFELTPEMYRAIIDRYGGRCFVTKAENCHLALAKAVPSPSTWEHLVPVVRKPAFSSSVKGAGYDLARIGPEFVERYQAFMQKLHDASPARTRAEGDAEPGAVKRAQAV